MATNRLQYNSFDTQIEALKRAFFAASMRKQTKDRSKIYKTLTMNASLISIPEDCASGQLSDLTAKGQSIFQIVNNGNFTNGTTGWAAVGATMAVANNTLSLTGGSTYADNQVGNQTTWAAIIGNKIFIKAKVRVTNSNCTKISVTLAGSGGGWTEKILQTAPTANTWYYITQLITIPSGFSGNLKIAFVQYYADVATATGKVMELQEVMAVDMVTTTETVDQVSLRFPTWLKYGIVSTLSGRLKCISQDNLVDSSKMVSGSTVSATDGSILVSTVHYRTGFIPVIPNTQYIFSGMNSSVSSLASFYDINKNYISRTSGAMYTTLPFTTPANAYYVIFNQGGYADQASQQNDFITKKSTLKLERGTVATTWKPYADTTAYTQDLATKWDSFNVLTGVKIQGGKSIVLNGTETWTALNTSSTNTVRVDLSYGISDIIDPGISGTTVPTHIYTPNLPIIARDTLYSSDVEGISVYGGTAYTKIFIRIAKSKLSTVDLAGVTAWLASNPLTLYYQLAVPIPTNLMPIGDTGINVEPGYIVMWEPACSGVKKPALGTGKIIVTTSDKQIKEIKKLIRFDEDSKGQLIFTDVLSSGSITDSGTSITITGADYTKNYFYDCDYVDGISTVPTTVIDYPIGEDQTGSVVTHNYGAAALAWTLTGDEAKATLLICTNAGGAANIIGPNIPGKLYIVRNTSGYTITIKTSSGTGVAVATGKTAIVINSGTDFVRVSADV